MREFSSLSGATEGIDMNALNLLADWDSAIVMIPVLCLLVLWMFALDERLAAPRKRPVRPHFCQADEDASCLCDPDGKPFLIRGPVTPPRALTDGTVEILPQQALP
jgi:hypothetical protein